MRNQVRVLNSRPNRVIVQAGGIVSEQAPCEGDDNNVGGGGSSGRGCCISVGQNVPVTQGSENDLYVQLAPEKHLWEWSDGGWVDHGVFGSQTSSGALPYESENFPSIETINEAVAYLLGDLSIELDALEPREVGDVANNLRLDWDVNGDVSDLLLTPVGGSLPADQDSYVLRTPISDTTSFLLTATLSNGVQVRSETTLNFYHRTYFGKSNNSEVTDQEMLSGGSVLQPREFILQEVVADNDHIYAAYPSAFGPAFMFINGMKAEPQETKRSFVNGSGHREEYTIFQTEHKLTGSFVIEIK